MKKFWKKHRVLIIVAIIAVLLVLAGVMNSMTTNGADPHAGHNHAAGDSHADSHTDPHTTQNSADPHAGHNHSDYDISKSWESVKNSQNDTYSIVVTTPHNEKLTVCTGLKVVPSCVKINNSILMAGNTGDSVVSNRWAVFCNGMTGQVSPRYDGCLATATQSATVVMGANNGTAVEVKDAFTGTVLSTTALPGAAASDGRKIIQAANWDQDGNLLVTYWAGETTKKHTVAMPRK